MGTKRIPEHQARLYLKEHDLTINVRLPAGGLWHSLVEVDVWKGDPDDMEEVVRTRYTVEAEPLEENPPTPSPCTGALRRRK